MAGRGAAPKPPAERKNPRSKPAHDWQPTEGVGWQGTAVPECPDGLLEPSRAAWATWMAAWFASHWTDDDLPGLRQVIRLYDQVERGEFQRAGELRLQMDTYGITPKGQQDRRWQAPSKEEPKPQPIRAGGRYGHLQAVSE